MLGQRADGDQPRRDALEHGESGEQRDRTRRRARGRDLAHAGRAAGGRPRCWGPVADAVPTSSVGAAVGSWADPPAGAADGSPVGAVADPSAWAAAGGSPVGAVAEPRVGAPVGPAPGALRSAWPRTTRWASRWKPCTSTVGHQRRRCTLRSTDRGTIPPDASAGPSTRAAATASCTARLIPTPPTGRHRVRGVADQQQPVARPSAAAAPAARRAGCTSSNERERVDPVARSTAAASVEPAPRNPSIPLARSAASLPLRMR